MNGYCNLNFCTLPIFICSNWILYVMVLWVSFLISLQGIELVSVIEWMDIYIIKYIYFIKSSYAEMITTVVWHLCGSELVVAWFFRLGALVVILILQWLSYTGEVKNPVLAQSMRLCASAVQIWHWEPGRFLERCWSLVPEAWKHLFGYQWRSWPQQQGQ